MMKKRSTSLLGSSMKNLLGKTSTAVSILLTIALVIILRSLFRPLWYDEALTVIDFMSVPTIPDIYRNYQIPNNHICFTILLRIWLNLWQTVLPLMVVTFRGLSVVFTCLTIAYMWIFWKKRFGIWSTLFTLLMFIFSLPFEIYSVAVRGYMFSFFLALFFLELVIRYTESQRKTLLIYIGIVSLLLVGIMPSTLIFMGAVIFLKAPKQLSQKKIINWVGLGIIPILALVLFYGPIYKKFFNIMFNLKEGWHSSFQAIIHYYGATVISLLPVIIIAIPGFFCALSKNFNKLKQQPDNRFGLLFHYFFNIIACLLPLLFFVFKNPAPFPRVFAVFWILYLFLITKFIRKSISWFRKKYGSQKILTVGQFGLLLIIIWGYSCIQNASTVAAVITPAGSGQDDFAKPYFMADFHPDAVVEEVISILKEQDPSLFFLNQHADSPSIIFYGNFRGIPAEYWLFDRPQKKLEIDYKQLTAPLYIICRDENSLKQIQKRFNIPNAELHKDCGYQKIYRAIP